MKQQTQAVQKVIVIDFGAQYGQLIARRVRDLQVYSEIVTCDIKADELARLSPSAIILSGGHASVYADDAPSIDEDIFDLGIPVLGFCYGHQITATALGGAVSASEIGEYGPATLFRDEPSRLLGNTPTPQIVWMSHRDAVSVAPQGFVVTASTLSCPIAAMEDASRDIYTTQFHPEVAHTEYGTEILENFLFDIAGLQPSWTMNNIIETKIADIREKVGNDRVILALSGGVDSAVTAALLHRALGDQLQCVFVNHGLLRKNEPESVECVFAEEFGIPLVVVDAQKRFLDLLAKVSDPEEKRSLIGAEFWKVFFEEAEKIGGVNWLAQGTIYPDIIESGARKTEGNASTIKSHHNLIPFPEGIHFKLIEPLDHFFKDEVRALGINLGLPEHVVYRQPFPGPGLALRIIGAVTEEKLRIVKEADALVREEIDAYNQELFEQSGVRDSPYSVWQYFAVLPDIKSVGVMGDERTYAYPIIIRAVESSDAMSADWAKLPHDLLGKISSRIVAEVPGVNRVAYDITSKPPATVEWE